MKLENDLWSEIKENYFPGLSKSSKELNISLKKLYSLNLKNDFDTLEQVIAGEDISLKQLNNISEDIFQGEEIVNEFFTYNFEKPDALKKTEQFDVTKEYFVNAIRILSVRKSEELSALCSNLKQSRNNLLQLSNIRIKADKVDELLFGINPKSARGIYELLEQVENETIIIPETSKKYHLNKQAIPSIKKDIEELKIKYLNFENSINLGDELKDLSKDVRTGFKKSAFAIKCFEADYFEGIIELTQLEEEIKSIQKRPNFYTQIKNNINNRIS
ncbi:MAG: hypothetical protein KKF89_02090, partial [Nanoarchaeota archaeon]|nr:hypothetical protein [Nanoarchaeota archaeon]